MDESQTQQLLQRKQLLLRKKELLSQREALSVSQEANQPRITNQQASNPLKIGINQGIETATKMINPGGRDFIPGMETPIVKQGMEAGNKIEQGILNNIPETLPIGIVSQLAAKLGIKPATRDVAEPLVSGSLDPRAIATGVGGLLEKPAINAISKHLPSYLEKKSAKKLAKAEDMFTRIADVPKGVISEAKEQGRKVPGIEYGTRATKKAKTVGELFETIVGEKKKAGSEKGELIKSLPATTSPRTYLNKAKDYINRLKGEGIHDEKEISRLEELIDQEIDYLNRTPESAKDPSFLDSRKQVFQKEAQSLYGKIQKGTATGLEPESHYIYDALAKGYKGTLEGMDPRVLQANQKSRGLIEATEFMRGPMESEATKPKRGFVLNAIDALRGGKLSTGAAAFRGIFGREVPFKKTSGKIEKLVGKSDRLSQIAKDLRGVKEAPFEATLTYPDGQRAIGANNISGYLPEPKSSGPAIRTPYNAPSGPTIYGESPPGPKLLSNQTHLSPSELKKLKSGKAYYDSNPIELPEHTQGSLAELARKYGVSEYGGPKESIQAPNGKLKPRNPELDAKVKRSLAEFAKRMKKK